MAGTLLGLSSGRGWGGVPGVSPVPSPLSVGRQGNEP